MRTTRPRLPNARSGSHSASHATITRQRRRTSS
jgi:hypothetical protein